jgi:hypothetical protein
MMSPRRRGAPPRHLRSLPHVARVHEAKRCHLLLTCGTHTSHTGPHVSRSLLLYPSPPAVSPSPTHGARTVKRPLTCGPRLADSVRISLVSPRFFPSVACSPLLSLSAISLRMWTCWCSKPHQTLIAGAATAAAMNAFRFLGDMTHLFSVLVLLLKIYATKTCSGKP